MVRRLLISWFLGLLSAGMVFLPMSQFLATSPEYFTLSRLVDEPGVFLEVIVGSLMLAFTVGLVISLPLLLIAAGIAFVFNGWITRFPLVFAGLAPLVAAVIVAMTDTFLSDNLWARTHPFWEKFQVIFLSWDTWMFALPVAVAASYYCIRASRRPLTAAK